jgi:hypothetical protein
MTDLPPDGSMPPSSGDPVGRGLVALAVRGRLIRLLTAELVAAWDAALAGGAAPADLVTIVDERRHAIGNGLLANVNDQRSAE